GVVHGLDAATGAVRWRAVPEDVAAPASVPAGVDPVWLAAAGDSPRVLGLDPGTGALVAAIELDYQPAGVDAVNDAVYVIPTAGLRAYGRTDLRLRWRAGGGLLAAPPVVEGGVDSCRTFPQALPPAQRDHERVRC